MGADAMAREAGGTGVIGRTLRRLAAGALPLLATLALAELVLRTFPAIVPISVGTAIYSVYTTAPGDIYFLDVPTRATFMWPDFHTRAYWNGYIWDHRTDARGFRNPPELHDPALVWLGDSMIYGHGVEERDTAAAQLRSSHGIAAYNAGRQADCLYQEYLVARLLLDALAPRTLVLTVFLNDFGDLIDLRRAEEIAEPPELAIDVSALAARIAHPRARTRPTQQLHRLKLWRLLALARHRASGKQVAQPAPGEPPAFLRAITEEALWAPGARYYERVIGDLAPRARERGAELVLLQLDVGDRVVAGALPAQDRVRALLEAIGVAHSLRVLTTRSLFERCDECFLPNDGHLSPEGHRRLAEFLASALREPHPRK
jgi:lysophospholipase L1-like esterase